MPAPPAPAPSAAGVQPPRAAVGGFWRRHVGILLPVGVALAAKLAALLLVYFLTGQPTDLPHRMATQWDGAHYLCIAREGYIPSSFYWGAGPDFPQVCNSIHFAPLYPFLIRLAGGAQWSALLVGNLASLAAVAVVAAHWGRRPALFLALFPSWIVYGTVALSEGVFVLVAALALAFLERPRRQVAAGVAAALAILARWVGGPPLLLAAVPWRAWRSWSRYGALLLVAAAGLAAGAWLWLYTGHLNGYSFAQSPWGGRTAWPWEHFTWLLHGWFTGQGGTLAQGNLSPVDFVLRDLVFLVPAAWGLALLLRQGPTPSAVYSAAALLMALCTSGLPAAGFPRLMLAAFPAIAILGNRLRDPWAWGAYAAVGVTEGTYGLFHHLFGYWS